MTKYMINIPFHNIYYEKMKEKCPSVEKFFLYTNLFDIVMPLQGGLRDITQKEWHDKIY